VYRQLPQQGCLVLLVPPAHRGVFAVKMHSKGWQAAIKKLLNTYINNSRLLLKQIIQSLQYLLCNSMGQNFLGRFQSALSGGQQLFCYTQHPIRIDLTAAVDLLEVLI